MKYLITLLLSTSLFVCTAQTNDYSLFRISENGKTGFINDRGQVIIKPIFLVAGEFSEGLACARINGTYGYIDKTGNFVIQAQYDYGTSFNDGLAIVYKEGKPFVINKKGQKPFEMIFPVIGPYDNGRARIKTDTKKIGFINTNGKLIIDTVFVNINSFINGYAVVEGLNHHPYADAETGVESKNELGVIDTLGNFIISYGKYIEINDFSSGYFKVEISAEPWDTIDGYSAQTGFVDQTGKLILAKSYKNNCWLDGDFHCGLARMNLYKYWQPEESGTSYTTEKNYEGFVNLKGETVINDTNYVRVSDFSDNRAFFQNENRDYFIIDTHGKIISKDTFSGLAGDGFKNGLAFVEIGGKYGMIDTSANFIVKPQYEGIDDVGILNGYFFFYEWNPNDNDSSDKFYGIAKKDGSVLLKPIMQEFARMGFQNGLLACMVNNKLAYINTAGEIVWQGPDKPLKSITNLNIDYMNWGYFRACSMPNKKECEDYENAENIPVKISSANNFNPKSLSVSVHPELNDTIFSAYKAITVFVANTSKKEIEFYAQDNRLYMKVQALNSKGEWKDIEYLPSSWCGNSYHSLSLDPKYCWKFMTPAYEGDIKTKLRIELTYIDPADKSKKRWNKKVLTIYSNEYEGSINPGQFWRIEDYYGDGIMDPYTVEQY